MMDVVNLDEHWPRDLGGVAMNVIVNGRRSERHVTVSYLHAS